MKRLKENAKSNTEEPKEEACGLNTLGSTYQEVCVFEKASVEG